MLWGVLAAGNVVFLVLALTYLGASYERFTWWGWTSYTLYTAIWAFYGRSALKDADIFFAAVALLIMFGVVAMATINNTESMLAEVARDEGLLVYFAGTFVVHYLPVAVIVSTCAPLHRLDVVEGKQIALALSFFCIYLLHEDPSRIYGVPIGQTLAAGSALGLGLLMLWLLWRLER